MLSKITVAALAASFIALGGCAQTETGNGLSQDSSEAKPLASTAPAKLADAKTTVASPAADTAAQVAITNPAIIEFDAQSVELNSQAQALIASLATPAKRSGKILITGYCDRRKTGNAVTVALSRATQVKNELVKNGVAAKTIRVKYITGQTKNIAKVELGNEPLRVDNSVATQRRN
jgi:outer membrane protein OmpA-like peptidoglycan-associated protein